MFSSQNKMLISGSQSELETLQFSAELDRSMQICHVIANNDSMLRNVKKGSHIRSQLYQRLHGLHVSTHKK